MSLRIKAALLLCLGAAACWSATAAWDSLNRSNGTEVPGEVYASFSTDAEQAQFYLREHDGYVAVYSGEKERIPATVTAIETESLRGADRAMLQQGIPVRDRQELLGLLEDLGS